MKKLPTFNFDYLLAALLKFLCRRLVKQGSQHRSRIEAYYRAVREAAEKEFTEDNKPTLDAFLAECHEKAKSPPFSSNR